MYRPAGPSARERFITGLQDLAAYLTCNPDIPVPCYSRDITVLLDSTETGGIVQVREFARLLDAPVVDEIAHGGHYYAEKQFGPICYRLVAIPEDCMARHQALSTYAGCVQPGNWSAPELAVIPADDIGDDFMNCPGCGDAENIAEIREFAFECGGCGATWTI
jgi:ribosomal protein S27AE